MPECVFSMEASWFNQGDADGGEKVAACNGIKLLKLVPFGV
jgi:hypothetical protein